MRKIYEHAKVVLSWLGPVTQERWEVVAVDAIRKISDFLSQKLNVSISDLRSMSNIYQDLILKKRALLPLPNQCEFSNDSTWKSLIWFFSRPYFTRVWVIQEISANKERLVHCGREMIEWEWVDLVASYVTMEPAFSKNFGFTETYCWWMTTMTELTRHPRNWLASLYLASTYSCHDPRDVIYGLRGLMEVSGGGELLDPDYNKSVLEVYRDSVEAALLSYQNTDVFTYVTGEGTPSWIPQWNQSMLFRNPFRFGRALPWKPAGETTPIWNIDKESNVLTLTGYSVGSVKLFDSYNEGFFSNAIIESHEGNRGLGQAWQRILKTLAESESQTPISNITLTAAATSFSFGLDENSGPADDGYLVHNFVAYLKIVLDENNFNRYVPLELSEQSQHADGKLFGKPAWDFKYPESSFFITETGFIGCSVASVEQGDLLIRTLRGKVAKTTYLTMFTCHHFRKSVIFRSAMARLYFNAMTTDLRDMEAYKDIRKILSEDGRTALDLLHIPSEKFAEDGPSNIEKLHNLHRELDDMSNAMVGFRRLLLKRAEFFEQQQQPAQQYELGYWKFAQATKPMFEMIASEDLVWGTSAGLLAQIVRRKEQEVSARVVYMRRIAESDLLRVPQPG
ncbi:MAG: hypothetical protein Q9169_008103 [Polycauliona sp. 2 TL-2023]